MEHEDDGGAGRGSGWRRCWSSGPDSIRQLEEPVRDGPPPGIPLRGGLTVTTGASPDRLGQRHGWRWLWAAGGLVVTVLAIGGLLSRYLSARFLPGVTVIPELQIRLPSDRLFTLWEVPVTNTLLASWLATLLLLGVFLAARCRSRLVPVGLQNVSEALLDALMGLVAAFGGKGRPAPGCFPWGPPSFCSSPPMP